MATLIELFKVGYDIGESMPRESRARQNARAEFGDAADDPQLFANLQRMRQNEQQETRADAQESRLGRQENRQQAQFDRQGQADDFQIQGARQDRSQQATLNLVNGLRSARDRGEDMGTAFDRVSGSLSELGIDPGDIPGMRQALLDNPAVLDDYYASLTGQTQADRAAAGGAGKRTAKMEQDAIDKVEGQEQLQALTGELREVYDQLDQGGGIVSATPKDIYDRVGRFISSSWGGRQIGARVGTVNETLRQQAEGARQLVIQGIKNATGMSAQELNSNFELQNMLRAATDPSLTLEANLAALDRIDSLYGGVQPDQAAPPAYVPGTKWRYIGPPDGNRGLQENWEMVQ